MTKPNQNNKYHSNKSLHPKPVQLKCFTSSKSSTHNQNSISLRDNELGKGKKPTDFDNGNYIDFNSLWINSLIHHQKKVEDERAKQDYQTLLCLPGSTVLPKATHSINQNRNLNKLREKTVHPLNDVKSVDALPVSCSVDLSFRKKFSPYIYANEKIRQALTMRKPFRTREQVRSKRLEQYMIITMKEAMAAIVLQSYWRRYRAIHQLALLKHKECCAIRIQAFVRGTFVRIEWKEWKRQCHIYAVLCQANIRRKLAIRKWIIQKEWERQNTTIIQSCVRSFLCKCVCMQLYRNRAITKIQALWRGQHDRTNALHMKLNCKATGIQTHARCLFASKTYVHVLEEKTVAVLDIQRCWRGFVARCKLSELIFNQSIFYRTCQTLMYKAEHEHICEKVHFEKRRIHNEDPHVHTEMLRKEIQVCMKELDSKCKLLTEEEQNYLELQYTKVRLTPYDVQRGWLEQIEKSLVDSLAKITSLKLDITFQSMRRVKETEQRLKFHEDLLAGMESKKTCFHSFVNESLKEMWDFKRRHDEKKETIRIRKNVGEEKRKWKFQPLSTTGKPFKMNHHEVRSSLMENIAVVDLLAHNQETTEARSTEERIGKLLDQVKLSLHRNQTVQYKAMLGFTDKLLNENSHHWNKSSDSEPTSQSNRSI